MPPSTRLGLPPGRPRAVRFYSRAEADHPSESAIGTADNISTTKAVDESRCEGRGSVARNMVEFTATFQK